MAQPYIGEIRMFAGNFAPVGWLSCEGQLLPIDQYETLFMLLGTTYGGDGQETFALPDLRGRLPIHQAGSYQLGHTGGAEEVTLTTAQVPVHNHALLATEAIANDANPVNNLLAQTSTFDAFHSSPGSTAMAVDALSAAGGSQPHSNMQPYLCVNFIISQFGLFPQP
jgi:microcystin-dependent protein